jgi:alpha-1,6-mannosyltransferase
VLQTRINTFGAIALLAHLAMTATSWPQASTLWDGEVAPRTQEFFKTLAAALPLLAPDRLFDGDTAVVIAHSIPLTIVSGVALALWVSIQRRATAVDTDAVRLLRRWAFAFAGVSFFAFPLFTQDFWLTAAWGRMIAEGHNPYYVDMIDESARGMPLDHFAMRMAYGPLWAWVGASVMLVSGESVLMAAVIFKAILAAAWLAAVVLIERLTRAAGPVAQAIGLILVGWLPVSVHQAVAEGHNDIALVALMLVWWFLMRHGAGWQAPIALAASTACKYVTGVLFVVDALHALRVEKLSLWRYALRLVIPAAIGLAAVGPFFRSLEYFDGLRMISSWGFMHFNDTFAALGNLTGLPLGFLAIACQLVFAGTALYYLVQTFRAPTPEGLNRTLVAVMAFMIFAASPHLWPWYLIWVLAPAALAPNWWLSRFIIGMSVAVPFVVGFWWVDAIEEHKDIAALLLHGTALVWTIATARLVPALPTAKAV